MSILFNDKWKNIKTQLTDCDEKVLFIRKGEKPTTQRQINLYYYFIFIKDVLNKIGAKDVLEIGCGRGTMSLYLVEHLGLSVSLLDSESDAIEIAKREFAKYDLPANFYNSDALRTNLESKKFDAIVSIGLAEHIDEVEKLFAEQYRILKPGGAMISLNIPQKLSIQYLNNIMRMFKKVFGLYKQDIKKDYYRNKLTPKDYKNIAEKVGFNNVEIVNVCPFPIYTPIMATTDKKIAKFNNFILKIRSIFQKYPFKTNYLFSQAHFLVAYHP